jgi:hypothetical protein
LSYDLDDFFTSGSKKKTEDGSKQLFAFVESVMLNLAEVVDQLDAKVTGFEKSLADIQGKLSTMSTQSISAPAHSAPSAAPPPGGAPAPPPGGAPAPPPGSVPAPPGGAPAPPGLPGVPASAAPAAPGLPPLPGMAAPSSPTPASSPSFGGPPGQPASPPPQKENPMMVQASLKNELAEAFKKIRSRLDEEG